MTISPRPSGLRVVQSAGAATASQIWRLAVTFGTMLAIRRMLGPEELAVWIWAEPLFVLFSIVRDLGVNGHVIRLDDRKYGSFLGLELLWGGLFSLIVIITAPWLVLLFRDHDAQTIQIVRVLAVFLWVQGLGLVPLTYFEAEQMLTRSIPAELVRNGTFALLALWWVSLGWGVWGVVLAHFAGSVVFALMLWVACRREIPLTVDLRAIPKLVRDSLGLALLSLFEQAVLYLDVLLLSLVVPREVAAKAGLAAYALFFFSRLVADAIGRAVYPAIVSYRDHPERAFGMYRVATLFLVVCFVPAAFFMHFNAELVALFLGGSEWEGAASYLRVAAFIPFVRPLTMFGREYLLVAHKDRLLIAYTLTNLVSLGALGYLLVTRTSLEELGMAVAGYFPLGTLFLAFGLWQLAPRDFHELIREMVLLYGLGLVIFAAVWLLPSSSPWPVLLGSSLGSMIFLIVSYRRHREELRAFLAWT